MLVGCSLLGSDLFAAMSECCTHLLSSHPRMLTTAATYHLNVKLFFSLLGLLLAFYVVWSVVHGNVAIRWGLRNSVVRRNENPAVFWISIGIYVLVILVLFFAFY